MRPPGKEVVEGWAAAIKSELSISGIRGNACIGATRVAVDVFNRAGLEAAPLAVNLFVLNPALVDRLKREGRLPSSGKELDQWNAEDGACLRVVGCQKSPGSWGGHLVAIVNRRWMVDLSLDQAEEPRRGIRLPRFVVWPAPRRFLSGWKALDLATRGRAGLIYEARPGDTSFQRTPAWNRGDRIASLVTAILKRGPARGGEMLRPTA